MLFVPFLHGTKFYFADQDDNEVVATISLDHCYSAPEGKISHVDHHSLSSELDSSDSSTPVPVIAGGAGSSRSLSPKRRSQRQIDRLEMEQLKKIRAENQEMLKKEKQEMNKVTPVKKEDSEDAEADATCVDATQPLQLQ